MYRASYPECLPHRSPSPGGNRVEPVPSVLKRSYRSRSKILAQSLHDGAVPSGTVQSNRTTLRLFCRKLFKASLPSPTPERKGTSINLVSRTQRLSKHVCMYVKGNSVFSTGLMINQISETLIPSFFLSYNDCRWTSKIAFATLLCVSTVPAWSCLNASHCSCKAVSIHRKVFFP
jgi:hypothetical protein